MTEHIRRVRAAIAAGEHIHHYTYDDVMCHNGDIRCELWAQQEARRRVLPDKAITA